VHFKFWRTELTSAEYYNTNGLGLLEFLEWTEGMGMQNVLAVYSGYSLGDAAEADVRYSHMFLYMTLTIDQGRRVSFLGCCTISAPERGTG
jgi:hypothetical protein